MRIIYTFSLLVLYFPVLAQNDCAYLKSGLNKKAGSISASDAALMNRYDVTYYKINLEAANNSVFIKGHAVMQAKVLQEMKDITLELHPSMLIDSVMLNDSLVSYNRSGNILSIHATDTLKTNSAFRLVTFYHGTATNASAGAMGNGYNTNASKKVSWSLSEPYSAYEWWPCKQILSDKSDSSAVWITCDSVNKVGSNGLLQNRMLLPNGKVRYEWKSQYPIAYYLISFTVCPYEEYNLYAHPFGSDSILVQNYIYKNAAPEVKQGLNYTPALIEKLSDKIGLYPFNKEKYGHCQAEIGGGMEHQTMTTMGDFSFRVIAHELGHQWFGDYVTCGSWSDIWLNEGLASYCEYIAMEALMPASKDFWLSEAMSLAQQASGTVYVNDSFTVSTIFDYASTYRKGAILLHMLRYEFNNDSLFFAGIRNYLNVHKLATALAPDFRKAMELTLGKDLKPFFNQWYYNPGYPVFTGKWNQLWNRKILINLKQEASFGNIVFKTSLDIKFICPGGDTIIRIWIDSISNTREIDVGSKTVTSIRLDPNNNILNEVISLAKNPAMELAEGVLIDEELTMYPNPANDYLKFKQSENCDVWVYNIAGVNMITEHLGEGKTSISLEALTPGIYIVKLSKSGSSRYVKFVKQ